MITCSEMTDDSDDDDMELSRVSGPRFGTAGGHLGRDDIVVCTHSYNACIHMHTYTKPTSGAGYVLRTF